MRWWPVYVGAASLSVLGGVLGGQAVVAGMQTGGFAAPDARRSYVAQDDGTPGGSIEPVAYRTVDDEAAGRDLLASLDSARSPQESGCSSEAATSCATPLP